MFAWNRYEKKYYINWKNKVQANLETKPVLYGNSNNSTYQNYALAGEIYEGGEGDIKVNYNKNTNRLKIIKKDDNDGKALEGVEFNIIDENGEIKYSKVKTNEKGEIIGCKNRRAVRKKGDSDIEKNRDKI